MGENFFHDDIKRRMRIISRATTDALLKPPKITVRISETVHVVDSQARHQSSFN